MDLQERIQKMAKWQSIHFMQVKDYFAYMNFGGAKIEIEEPKWAACENDLWDNCIIEAEDGYYIGRVDLVNKEIACFIPFDTLDDACRRCYD